MIDINRPLDDCADRCARVLQALGTAIHGQEIDTDVHMAARDGKQRASARQHGSTASAPQTITDERLATGLTARADLHQAMATGPR